MINIDTFSPQIKTHDEECLEFRIRLDLILHCPGESWPPIDPKGWVTGSASPNWQATCKTSWGSLTAGDMFAPWVAHELLYPPQLVELQYAYTSHTVQPHIVIYPGEW